MDKQSQEQELKRASSKNNKLVGLLQKKKRLLIVAVLVLATCGGAAFFIDVKGGGGGGGGGDIPTPSGPWTTTPGCDVSDVAFLQSPITCNEVTLDVVTSISLSAACVILDENPLGYYMTHTVYTGWSFVGADGVTSDGWFVDMETNQTVIGPAAILSQWTYPECGIPGNP